MEKTEKPNANFNGRPSTLPGRPKLLTLAITGAILGAGFGAIGVAQAVDRTTEYDEKRHTRQNVWEVRQYDQEPSSVTGLDEANPAPPVAVDRNNNVSMDTLYRRLEANKDNTGFGTFLNQVDRYEEEDIPEWDRRITALEDMEYWEAAPPETTDWITTGRLQETPWEPPTTGMTSDFTQTRWVRLAQERRTHQQERNLDTGELRTVSTSVETRAEDIKESRQVKVTSTPETMVRSGYGCTEFLPKADTVAKGTTFDQSRTCYNDYEKHIYYLVNGTVIDSDTRLRTEPYKEWNYNVAGTYVEAPAYTCKAQAGPGNTLTYGYEEYNPPVMGITGHLYAGYHATNPQGSYFGPNEITGWDKWYSGEPVPTQSNPYTHTDGREYWVNDVVKTFTYTTTGQYVATITRKLREICVNH